jgi:deoxyribodipyrimidine photolyase-related protein
MAGEGSSPSVLQIPRVEGIQQHDGVLPNVLGMSLYADGGMMATKPYAAGGNYINTMSDYCGGCRFDPRKRVGPGACPFTTLYWNFLEGNREALTGNHRMARQLAAANRLGDMDAVREHAVVLLNTLDSGEL